MKAIILLAVCILCGESKLEYEFTEASSPALRSLIATAVRNKRQVGVRSCEEVDMHITAAILVIQTMDRDILTSSWIVLVMSQKIMYLPRCSLDYVAEMRMKGYVLSLDWAYYPSTTPILWNTIVHT